MTKTSRSRWTDRISQGILVTALVQLAIIALIVATSHAQVSQAVVNQRQTDRVDVLVDRVTKLERIVDQMPTLVERVDRAVKDMSGMQSMQMAIFVGLALNLMSTIIQIRTQQTRRSDSPPTHGHREH